MPHSLNLRGQLVSLERPLVMGILNLTPDSFYADSRATVADVRSRVEQMVAEGVDIIDVGAVSTRPGHDFVSEEEELRRLREGLPAIVETAAGIPISVDTFRANVARVAVEEYDVAIINDVSSGADPQMFSLAARLGVPYVLTACQDVHKDPQPLRSMFVELAKQINRLRELGAKDIILDPGIGFGKTREQNFLVLKHLEDFREFGLPLLVGLSRKSFIYETLQTTPADSLFGTIALNALALERGANILRVHDVLEAKQTVNCQLSTVN